MWWLDAINTYDLAAPWCRMRPELQLDPKFVVQQETPGGTPGLLMRLEGDWLMVHLPDKPPRLEATTSSYTIVVSRSTTTGPGRPDPPGDTREFHPT